MPSHRFPLFLSCLLCIAVAVAPATAESPLHAYESCHFPDGLEIVSIDSLPAGVQQRSVQTKAGPKPIAMLDGRRIMFGYPMEDFYANVKPELLPADTWALEKKTLLDALDFMLTSDHGILPNPTMHVAMHGLEVRGFDRTVLTGGVLGFYLFFDEQRHIATSIYLLNQEPMMRKFQTIEQYRVLRDQFITIYAGCIAQNQQLESTAH